MESVAYLARPGRAAAPTVIAPGIDPGLAGLLRRCASVLYSAIGHPNAPTACIFTSLVLADALTALGHEARPAATAVEGRAPGVRFGIGHPSYSLVRPGAWKGHLVCMIGDVLVDPTISQVGRHGVPGPPLLAAVQADRPWIPDGRCELLPGVFITWLAEGGNRNWSEQPDALAHARSPVVARVLRRLREPEAEPTVLKTSGADRPEDRMIRAG